ncbi:hypothetical protein [Methylobacterium sp. 22177]|uniref:hypothetical protein n=1 Tax=Methylobacterium sp. 22177 TaxID=3453885 RepID=UPI003F861A2E
MNAVAMTNAERQAQYRARLKVKGSAGVELGAEIVAFREVCARKVAEIAAQGNEAAFDLSDLLAAILDGDEAARGLQGPLLARALGLPSDPWPHLTGNSLRIMIGGRIEEAERLGFPVGLDGGEVDFVTKLRADRHLDWLVQDDRAEAA